MKRLFLLRCLVAVLAAAVLTPDVGADDRERDRRNDHRRHPGYVEGLRFVDMADPDGRLIEVNITGRLLRLLSTRALRRHDADLADVLDGLVSVQSAQWGEFLGTIPADHMDEIGQIADVSNPSFDVAEFFLAEVRRLAALGL